MNQEKKGFWGNPGNRIVVWMILIAGLLAISKVLLPYPYPQIHQKALTAYDKAEYNEIIKWAIEAQDVYPERYKENNLGYFKAYALNKLGEHKKSQSYLMEYIGFVKGPLHVDTRKLEAANYLSLGDTDAALGVIIELYKKDPFHKQGIIDEVHEVDPNLNLFSRLDPTKDEFAIDILQARVDNLDKRDNYDGVIKFPAQRSSLPLYLRESIFFQLRSIKTKVNGEGTLVTGKISSRINIASMGFRLTAFNQDNLYLDEVMCLLKDVKKKGSNSFSCQVPDQGPFGSLHLQELSYEL